MKTKHKNQPPKWKKIVKPMNSRKDVATLDISDSKKLQFDIDRLARDIDDIFQEHVQNNTQQFSQTVSVVTSRNLDAYRAEIIKHIKESKADLFKEFEKGRSIIHIEHKNLSIDVENNDHPKYESVVQTLMLTNKAMLVGPAGTGKTYMVNDIAKRLNLPFYKYSCSRDSSVHDLLGYKQPTSETYLETVFLNAYENGGIFLVDEYDAMSGDMSLFFNGVSDNSNFISVPHRDVKPIAKKHKDFYLVMCGNTWGKGSHLYSGRDFQDQALLDRFRLSRHFIDYHKYLEKSLCYSVDLNYTHVQELRSKLESIGSYLSTRNIEDICKLKSANIPMKDIINQLTNEFSVNEKTIIDTFITSVW